MNKYFLFLLLIPFAFFSCKKDKTVSAEDQAKIDKAVILKYLADNSLIADSTASGLYYIIKDAGVGAKPSDSSYIKVYYNGSLTNGISFDKTEPGLPRDFFLYQTIKGWIEGVKLIGKDGEIQLFIPSALGYGTSAQASIPASSVLIFNIKLASFQ